MANNGKIILRRSILFYSHFKHKRFWRDLMFFFIYNIISLLPDEAETEQ